MIIWNAQASHRISSRNQNEKNNFDGLTVSASPEMTICAGKIVYRNGKLTGEKLPNTRFVALQTNAPHVFSVVQLRDKTLNLSKPTANTTRKDSAASNGSNGGIDARPSSRDRGQSLKLRMCSKLMCALISGSTPQDNVPEKQRPITKVIHPPGIRFFLSTLFYSPFFPGGRSTGFW